MLRLGLLTCLLLIVNSLFYLSFFHTGTILGTTATADVTVTATIPICPKLYIDPENRIPPTDNDSLEIHVDIRPENSSTPIWDTTVTTDNGGMAHLCPIPNGLITNSHYDVLVKGLSHLRRIYPHQYFLGGAGLTLDLRKPVLFAGDSHPSSDNYVNSLDISYEILHLYTNNLRADLNRDTIVNSLEFPTLISHLYKYGDY